MNNPFHRLDELTRREFAARAAKACLGVSLFPGVSALAGAEQSGNPRTGRAKNCIYLFMTGGMTHLDTFDLKPKSKTQGPVKGIPTSAKGVVISEWFPRLAKHMDKVAVVRSMSSTQGDHIRGQYFMRTSYPKRGTIMHPAMGAWLLRLTGPTNATIPGNVRISEESQHPGAGFFEEKYAPMPIPDAAAGLQHSKLPAGVDREQLNTRVNLSSEFDRDFRARFNQKSIRSYSDAYRDAIRLMSSRDLKAFNIFHEPQQTRRAYGATAFGDGCLLARRLVENGVRFVEVTLGGWDNHANNFVQGQVQARMLDQALSSLLSDLSGRGLLDETLVVLATEMGRTPTINQNNGRDHWPQTFSCLLAGGGIRGGQTYGKTDATGAEVVEDHVDVPSFNATIATALGLPLKKIVTSPSRRPFTVANKAEPVVALF